MTTQTEQTVQVSWYCVHFVGSPKWQPGIDWVYEPDECGTEFETTETLADWQEGCCTATCPRCSAELYQGDDEPWLVKDKHDFEATLALEPCED